MDFLSIFPLDVMLAILAVYIERYNSSMLISTKGKVNGHGQEAVS